MKGKGGGEKRRILPNRNDGRERRWVDSFAVGRDLNYLWKRNSFFRRLLLDPFDSPSQPRPLICVRRGHTFLLSLARIFDIRLNPSTDGRRVNGGSSTRGKIDGAAEDPKGLVAGTAWSFIKLNPSNISVVQIPGAGCGGRGKGRQWGNRKNSTRSGRIGNPRN